MGGYGSSRSRCDPPEPENQNEGVLESNPDRGLKHPGYGCCCSRQLQGKYTCRGEGKGVRKKKPGDEEPVLTTSDIRRERLKRLEETRPQLTDAQIEILAETWALLQNDLDSVGSEMFVKLFETYPDVRGAFGPFKSLSPDDVRLSQELRAHGLRVLSTVGCVLEKRRETRAVVEHLYELGSKHITFNAKSDYIDIVSQQFLFAVEPVLGDRWTPEVEQAWADLFRLIAHVMREGMVL